MILRRGLSTITGEQSPVFVERTRPATPQSAGEAITGEQSPVFVERVCKCPTPASAYTITGEQSPVFVERGTVTCNVVYFGSPDIPVGGLGP